MYFQVDSLLERKLNEWSKPASNTEEEKCENAIRMIRGALNNSDKLKNLEIKLIPKGSYHNNTNVRLTSDVDIAVRLTDTFFQYYPNGKTHEDFGNIQSNYSFKDYRRDVEEALINKFNSWNIDSGDKAIRINSNTYRVDADVVPCFEYRRYHEDGTYELGTSFITQKSSIMVINYPEQHYTNGVQKNNVTYRRYKRVVRIFKRIKYMLIDNGYSLDNISSFLIECLIWNVPNNRFNHSSISEDVSSCFHYLISNTATDELCKDWGEVSELLYLFNSQRKYTRSEVHDFLNTAYVQLFK